MAHSGRLPGMPARSGAKACKAKENLYRARLTAWSARLPPRLRGRRASPRAAVKHTEFKEQVPQWLSLREKYRRIAGAIAGHMIR